MSHDPHAELNAARHEHMERVNAARERVSAAVERGPGPHVEAAQDELAAVLAQTDRMLSAQEEVNRLSRKDPAPRKRWPWAVAAVFVLLIVVIAAAGGSGDEDDQPISAVSPSTSTSTTTASAPDPEPALTTEDTSDTDSVSDAQLDAAEDLHVIDDDAGVGDYAGKLKRLAATCKGGTPSRLADYAVTTQMQIKDQSSTDVGLPRILDGVLTGASGAPKRAKCIDLFVAYGALVIGGAAP